MPALVIFRQIGANGSVTFSLMSYGFFLRAIDYSFIFIRHKVWMLNTITDLYPLVGRLFRGAAALSVCILSGGISSAVHLGLQHIVLTGHFILATLSAYYHRTASEHFAM